MNIGILKKKDIFKDIIIIQISTMADERTYIMIKPDGVQRGLVGEIISRFEKKGFFLRALKQTQPSE